MMDRDDYATRITNEAIKIASSGLDLASCADIQQNLVEALLECSKVLKGAKYNAKNPEGVARAAAHTMKGLDMLTRLAEYSRGNPDSRPSLQGDWLQGLTEEQLALVQRWVQENAERVEVPELHESGAEHRA